MKKDYLKRFFALALALALMFQVLPAFSSVQAAETVRLSTKSVTLTAGQTKKLKLKGVSSANKVKISWSSSKKSVAAVDKNGMITAKKAGKAVITAKYSGKKYKCSVTVKKNTASVKIKKSSISVKKGQTKTIWVKAVNIDELSCSSNNSYIDFSWGAWKGSYIALKVKGINVGKKTVLKVYDSTNESVSDSITVKVVSD